MISRIWSRSNSTSSAENSSFESVDRSCKASTAAISAASLVLQCERSAGTASSAAISSPDNPAFPAKIAMWTPHSYSRSEEHTSELQSLMRISYAVFCLKQKTISQQHHTDTTQDN